VTAARLPLRQRFLRAGIVPRLVAILIGVPCLYVITLRGGIFFLLLVDLIILIGLTEFFRLMEAKLSRRAGAHPRGDGHPAVDHDP